MKGFFEGVGFENKISRRQNIIKVFPACKDLNDLADNTMPSHVKTNQYFNQGCTDTKVSMFGQNGIQSDYMNKLKNKLIISSFSLHLKVQLNVSHIN